MVDSLDVQPTTPPTTTTVAATTATITTTATTITATTTTVKPEPIPGQNLPKMQCISAEARKKRSINGDKTTVSNEKGVIIF